MIPFTVGDWLVEPKACRASRGDRVVKLRPQLADLLACLARRAGEIVLKDEILAEVWPGQYIAESGLSRCVAELRQVLQDDAQEPRFIQTFPKRGYRLIAPVVWLDDGERQGGATVKAAPERESAEVGLGAAVHRRPAEPAAEAPLAARPMTRRRRGAWIVAGLGLLAIGVVTVVVLPRSPASVLTEQDAVLLAFENKTGDPVFDDTVPLAVSIQLEQSPYLGLLSPARIREALRMMRRAPETPLTRQVGMEICERVGARALIVTSVARLGSQYAVGLEAVACGTGRVLARRQATLDRKEGVLGALERAAVEIRRAVGEPTTSIDRFSVPIEATTSSLEALRAVRRGDVARESGQNGVALGLYREAVALDGDFALAFSRLGATVLVEGTEAEAFSAFERAFALRQHVTLPERLEIEAAYHRHVTGERARVVEALELLKRSYPRRALIRRNLVEEHTQAGRYDAALSEAGEAVRLEPNSAMNLAALARAHLYLHQLAKARAVAEEALAHGGVSPMIHVILFQCALAGGDQGLLARVRAWAAEHPEAAGYWLDVEAEEAVNRGRLREAGSLLQQAGAWATAQGAPATASVLRLRIARYEALCGLGTQAMRRVDAEMSRPDVGPVLRMDAVKVAISAGEFDRAERLLDNLAREGHPGASQPGATFARAYRAAIAAHRGQPARALEMLAPLQPFELGLAYGFIPLFERAKAHLQTGDWANARLAFEAILAHSTVDSGRKLLPHAQLGLARTLARAGDAAASRRTYEQFFDRWRRADPDLPVLLQARREYDALPR